MGESGYFVFLFYLIIYIRLTTKAHSTLTFKEGSCFLGRNKSGRQKKLKPKCMKMWYYVSLTIKQNFKNVFESHMCFN